MLNLPNTLTLLRIVAIPAFLIALTNGRYDVGLCLFLAAGITDAVDGAVARITDTHTEFGAFMDPVADKLLMASSFVMLAWYGAIPVWLTILVLSRDVVILLGYFALSIWSQPIDVQPSGLGKVNTFFQLMTVGMVLVALSRPDIPLADFNLGVEYVTGATTTASGIQYVYRGLLWQQTHPLASGTQS